MAGAAASGERWAAVELESGAMLCVQLPQIESNPKKRTQAEACATVAGLEVSQYTDSEAGGIPC